MYIFPICMYFMSLCVCVSTFLAFLPASLRTYLPACLPADPLTYRLHVCILKQVCTYIHIV